MLENRSWKCWAVGLALCVVGCGSGADDIGAAGAGGSGGGSQLDLPSSLTFETPATLTMIPGEAREVTVVASPARS